ncbi:phosphotransferase [Bacillus sp. N9]
MGKSTRRFSTIYSGKSTSLVFSYTEQCRENREWALEQMKADPSFFQKEPHCIIHGDVAYHNFIRGKDGKLYVIDFDLIRIASAMIDILQFCNRILPSLRWDARQLFSFPRLRPYKENPSF